MIKSPQPFPRLSLNTGLILGLILIACFLLVCFSVKSYGASYDEALIQEYSSQLAKTYENLVFYKPFQSLIEFYDLRYYGPAFWTAANLAASGILTLFPALDSFDAWHILNFATFLLGVWCLYCLIRRFASPGAALVAALLYLTQPLLWGHGVINPKDTPFATFFLATVLIGMRMVEEQAGPAPTPAREPGLAGQFNLLAGKRKFWLGMVALVAAILIADLIFSHFISRPAVSALISSAFSAPPGSFLHNLFLKLAANSDATSPAAYIDKAMQIVNIGEFALALLAGGLGAAFWLWRTPPRNRWMVLAGAAAGFTVAIRILGPAAMGLVALYAVLKLGRRSIRLLLAYLGVAVLVLYAAWPYLWGDPLNRFVESWSVMANFPWPGQVRFEGSDLRATVLPWYYLPKLIGIQLTLPLLILAAAGALISIKGIVQRRPDRSLALISILWFGLPMAGVLLAHPSMYDNFRQFLFILPPLFVFAAAALDALLPRLRYPFWKVVLSLAIVAPGVVAGVWLHPYEYVYYNALVGWTGNVQRAYEGDYWFTSLCEAGRYLDAQAPDGSRIALTDQLATGQFKRCMHRTFDIVVERTSTPEIDPRFSVIPSRYDDDLDYFRNMQIMHVIGRGNTIFMVIKQAP